MQPANNQSTTTSGGGGSEQFFSKSFKLFNCIPSAVVFSSNLQEGNINRVSETAEGITGYPVQHFVRGGIKSFLNIVHPKDLFSVLRLYVKLTRLAQATNSVKKSTLSKSLQLRIIHQQGYWLMTELAFMVLDYSTKGSIGRVFGILRRGAGEDQLEPGLRFNEYYSRVLQTVITNYGSDHPPFNYSSNTYNVDKVSKREKQVLHLIAHGYSSKMVAEKLCISIHTAARHRTNLLEKFRVSNTAELVLVASRKYWL